jgi:uncharacterized membrane protein
VSFLRLEAVFSVMVFGIVAALAYFLSKRRVRHPVLIAMLTGGTLTGSLFLWLVWIMQHARS